jgi:hypothetical protein
MSGAPRGNRTWLGTTVDMHAVKRDAVLAGVFGGTNVFAVTRDPLWFLVGTAYGAFIGMILHVLPAEPQPGDARRGRIIIRTVCGMIGGAGSAATVAYLASGVIFDFDNAPELSTLVEPAVWGALLGGLWYLLWGVWETRDGAVPVRSDD